MRVWRNNTIHGSTSQEDAKTRVKILQRNLARQRYNDKRVNHWHLRQDHKNKNNQKTNWAREMRQTIDGHHQCATMDTSDTNRSITTSNVDTSKYNKCGTASNNRDTNNSWNNTATNTNSRSKYIASSADNYIATAADNCWPTNGNSTKESNKKTTTANAKERTTRWDYTRQWTKATKDNRAAAANTKTWASRTTDNKDEDKCNSGDYKESWNNHHYNMWGWTRSRTRKDSTGTNGPQHRRTWQEENNRRNEAWGRTNEETRCLLGGKHQWSHTRTTSDNHRIKMGVERQRRQSKSKNSSKRIHWTNWRCRHKLCKHTNFLHTSYPSYNGNGQTMDSQSRWHFSSIPTCQCSNKRFVHAAPTRVLQWLLANSMATPQSNVWTKKFTISMAKSPSTNPTRS